MNANASDSFFLRRLSQQDFAAFGTGAIAYVKPVDVDGSRGFAVHAADGTPLMVAPDRELAFAAVRQNELEPLSVH